MPDISKWNLSKVYNIAELFSKCSSLKELPDISKWNLSNVNCLTSLFFKCSSLISLPDISKWNLFNSNINNYELETKLEFKPIFNSKYIQYINEEEFKSLSSYYFQSYENDSYSSLLIFSDIFLN